MRKNDHDIVPDLSDERIVEHAWLIRRGVRHMVMLAQFPSDPVLMLRVATRLETLSHETDVPFVIDRGDGTAECGFAASVWVAETFQWILQNVQEPYRSRVIGLLLGYSTSAITDFEQKQSFRGFTVSLEPKSN